MRAAVETVERTLCYDQVGRIRDTGLQVNECSYLRAVGWGHYYLVTVMDDFNSKNGISAGREEAEQKT